MSAHCWVALTTLAGEAEAYELGDRLEGLGPTGVGVFEIEDGSGRWEVGGYFTEAPDEAALGALSALFGARPFAVSEVGDHDWVAQVRRELTPVRAGRFIVFGGHDRERIPANLKPLEIEAAMAFGTGHHGTTAGCLLSLERLLRRGETIRRVADVGCGTGVLAMAAARQGGVRAIATDIDPVAAEAATANAIANKLRGRIAVGVATGLRHQRLRAGAPFDLIFANILAKPLKQMAPALANAARDGGRVVLSGLLVGQKRDVAARFRAWGFQLEHTIEREGWATLTMRRNRRTGKSRRF